MLSKFQSSVKFILNKNLLHCPICNKSFYLKEGSLVCENNHNFNIAKNGSVCLVKGGKLKIDKHYDKNLFFNRRSLISEDFFKPVEEVIITMIKKYKNPLILDLGCGEGSIGFRICREIKDSELIFFDYSKIAINMATDFLNEKQMAIVSDVNFIPIKDRSIDVILNFLSPINPIEAKRVLKPDGIILKVIPQKMYLKEIREVIGKEYATDVELNLRKKFNIIQSKEIIYEYVLDDETLRYLINMTPLTMNNDKNIVLKKVTIDLKLLIMKCI